MILKLRYFIANNTSNNDTTIYTIYQQLYLDIKDLDSRRIKYLNYIINLLVKTFLFREDSNIFELTTNDVKKLGKLEALQAS